MESLRLGRLEELDDPGCREFRAGEGDWPLRGFVVRKGDAVFAYQNYCMHVGHPLNLMPDRFLTRDGKAIVCASHGALYEIETGKCIAGPCKGEHLRPIPCRIQNGEILVTL